MDYNLTENQKELLRWLVQQVCDEKLPEEFYVVWFRDAGKINGYRGEHPEITKGTLDALANADLLLCTANYKTITSTSGSKDRPRITHREEETNRRCTLTGQAFDAVDKGFELPIGASTQVTIGAIIYSMSGGNVQAVGVAMDAEIAQIVNDPDLLRSQVEALTENLLDEVKGSLRVDELAEYAQTVRDLKEQLVAEKPQLSLIRRLVRTVGLLGDIEGTIGLMTRVWALLHPLLLIAAARLG
jgi:hypothetical protein